MKLLMLSLLLTLSPLHVVEVDSGWHLSMPEIIVDEARGVEQADSLHFRTTAEDYFLAGRVRFMMCSDEACTPPQEISFQYGEAPREYRLSSSPVLARGLVQLLLLGILAGLAALLTPCVWPVVPMTVGLFLRRGRGVRDAVAFGASILVIYVGLGMLVTMLFGAGALNALSTNAVVNVVLFLLLAVFGLSMIGLFELRLPSSWANAVSGTSPFLLALTLALVSFSCTAPIVGFLLVEASTRGSVLAPLAGMTGFALALALPFALFALFPRWLGKLPRSGEWMADVKASLGFVELLFAFKFLSVADLAYGWGVLPRWLFFVLWMLVFLAWGAFLARRRRWLALLPIAFALYCAPGIFGARCTLVSAFAPPLPRVSYEDYDAALAEARRTSKPVFLNFTGYGCVNCRKMEAAVLSAPAVEEILQRDFIVCTLHVDDRRTGSRWAQLQRERYGTNAQPYYLIVASDGTPLAEPRAYNEDIEDFILWLTQR